MPLQNRVDPFGELVAVPARGLFMGNRGGRFHTDAQTLATRRWVSRQWICCVLEFKKRRRAVWGRFYTELFFLDEPTALAAGHRPCFECRRKDAEAFAEHWRQAHQLRARPRAAPRAFGRPSQAPASAWHRHFARWRLRRDRRRGLCRPPRVAAVLDAGRLRRARATAAGRHGRCAYTACNP